jgi:hypothetical protein
VTKDNCIRDLATDEQFTLARRVALGHFSQFSVEKFGAVA